MTQRQYLLKLHNEVCALNGVKYNEKGFLEYVEQISNIA